MERDSKIKKGLTSNRNNKELEYSPDLDKLSKGLEDFFNKSEWQITLLTYKYRLIGFIYRLWKKILK